MTIEAGAAAAPTAADEFDTAFAEFSVPEPSPAANDGKPAAEAPAAAATGGENDGTGSGDAGAAAGGGESGAAAGAGGGDGGAGGAEGGQGGEAGSAEPKSGEAAPAAGASGEGGAAPAGDAGAAPAGEPKPAAAAPAPAGAAGADEILNRLSELVAAAPKPTAEAGAEAPKPAEEPKPIYSKEEIEQMQQFEKDWPDVARIGAMQRRGEYTQLLGHVFGEIQKVLGPIQEQLSALAGRTHLSDLKAEVPDYSDNLRQSVIDWAKTQPSYLQSAYDHVIQNGTPDEVKDLVVRYRQATGQAAPAPGGAAEPPKPKPAKDNELSGAAKEAAAALAPVESKRSEVLQPGDPSNYDDAWVAAAKDLG